MFSCSRVACGVGRSLVGLHGSPPKCRDGMGARCSARQKMPCELREGLQVRLLLVARGDLAVIVLINGSLRSTTEDVLRESLQISLLLVARGDLAVVVVCGVIPLVAHGRWGGDRADPLVHAPLHPGDKNERHSK